MCLPFFQQHPEFKAMRRLEGIKRLNDLVQDSLFHM